MGDKLEGADIVMVVPSDCTLTGLSAVSKDMDTETRRLPLGVCARYIQLRYLLERDY